MRLKAHSQLKCRNSVHNHLFLLGEVEYVFYKCSRSMGRFLLFYMCWFFLLDLQQARIYMYVTSWKMMWMLTYIEGCFVVWNLQQNANMEFKWKELIPLCGNRILYYNMTICVYCYIVFHDSNLILNNTSKLFLARHPITLDHWKISNMYVLLELIMVPTITEIRADIS